MKILHVLDHSLPLHSGYVFRTMGILREQRHRGWDPILLTSPKHNEADKTWAGDDDQSLDGWTILRTQSAGSRFPFVNEAKQIRATYKRILTAVDEHQPQIIHAHSPALNGLPALWAGRKCGLPVAYEIRAFWEDAAISHLKGQQRRGLKYWATRQLESHVVSRCDEVFVICNGLKRDLLTRGLPEDKVTIIPNAVDLAAFTPAHEPNLALRDSLGLRDSLVIGFIGSFYHYEGLDYLIRAVPKICKAIPNVRVLLVGGGTEDESLKALVSELELEDVIVFTGRVPFSSVHDYYDQVDILVYPRRKMRLTDLVTPLKPLEAMAQERILAASDIEGHAELIQHNQTGYLFPPDSVDGLADHMIKAIAARDDWDRIKRQAKHFVSTERNWAKSVSRYEEPYQRLVAQ